MRHSSDCCKLKTQKKYKERNAPPYGANEGCCMGKKRLGNDGKYYISTMVSNGVYRWKKIDNKASKQKVQKVQKVNKKIKSKIPVKIKINTPVKIKSESKKINTPVKIKSESKKIKTKIKSKSKESKSFLKTDFIEPDFSQKYYGIQQDSALPISFLFLYPDKFVFYTIKNESEQDEDDGLRSIIEEVVTKENCVCYTGKYECNIKYFSKCSYDIATFPPKLLKVGENRYLFFEEIIYEFVTDSPIETFCSNLGNSYVNYSYATTKEYHYMLGTKLRIKKELAGDFPDDIIDALYNKGESY